MLIVLGRRRHRSSARLGALAPVAGLADGDADRRAGRSAIALGVADRHRGRRGDAARGSRAYAISVLAMADGARCRLVRRRAAARRSRAPGLAAGLRRRRSCSSSCRGTAPPTAREPPLRWRPTPTRPSPDAQALLAARGVGAAAQPLRRAGVVLPEPLPEATSAASRPRRISLFTLVTNTPGGIGIIVGGKLADMRGRRVVGAVALVGGTIFTVAAFCVGGAGRCGWRRRSARSSAAPACPALGVYGAELFPTGSAVGANGCDHRAVAGRQRRRSRRSPAALSTAARLRPAMALLAVGPLIVAVLVVPATPRPPTASSRTSTPRTLALGLAATVASIQARPPAGDASTTAALGAFQLVAGRPRSTRASTGPGDGRGRRLQLLGRAERIAGAGDEQARHLDAGQVLDAQLLGLARRMQRDRR